MERSRDWMDQAGGDLAHAKSDVERGFYDWSCFSCQQAAEKAIKAVFQKVGVEAWGGSVADLLTELLKKHPVPEDLINGALEVDKAYIPTRYPNAHPSGSPRIRYTAQEARRLIAHAEKIIQVFSKGLKEKLRLVHVVFFGSFAKGDINEGSDVDIVVVTGFKEGFLERVKLSLDLNGEIMLPLEPVGYTSEEFQRMKEKGNPFIREVLASGKLLYGMIPEGDIKGEEVGHK